MAWWKRLVNLTRSDSLSKDIDRELAFHIQERIDELVASGMDEAAARREATRRFGEPLLQRERTRDADVLVWLDTFVGDVRHGFRAMRRNPAFSLVAIVSLALGIGANTAIFSLIDAILLESLPVQRPRELVRITRAGESTVFTNPIWEELRDNQDVLSGVFAYAHVRFNLVEGGEARRVAGNWVSGDFFGTLGVQPAIGRLLRSEDDIRGCPPVAVLSHSFWRSTYAGDPGVVGSSLSLDGRQYTVIGVAAARFTGVTVGLPVQVFAPICAMEIGAPGALDRRSAWYIRVLGRVPADVPLTHVQARLAAMAPAVYAATIPSDWGVEAQQRYLEGSLGVEPASNGDSFVRSEYTQPLLALMAVVGIVLLISCVNVANLLLARSAARRPELAIRLAIGAGRARLLRQMLTESVLLAIMGALAGTIFAQWSSRMLVRLLGGGASQVQLDLSMNARVLGFTIVIAMITGVLFGLAPAWSSTRFAPHRIMKATGRTIADGYSRHSAGRVLVAAQVALSVVLLVGAGLLTGTFRTLVAMDPGFDREGVLLVDVRLPDGSISSEGRAEVYRELLDRFRAVPGARSASASNTTPISGNTWNNIAAADGYVPTSRDDALVYLNEVSDEYFSTMRTALIVGRDFDQRDVPGGQRVALINRTMADRFFGEANPIGREFRLQFTGDEYQPPTRIIGVVEDAKYESLREMVPPTAYLSLRQNAKPGPNLTYELRSVGAAEALIRSVRDAAAQVDPTVTLEFSTLDSQVRSSLTRERMLALLTGFFGGLALLLAVIGLYGTLSYSVARRRRELAVRLALGASPARVLRMVLGEASVVVVAGLAVGVIAALASVRLIASFLFGLSATDPTTILFAASVLAVVALVASALPAWRAANTDTLIPLRED